VLALAPATVVLVRLHRWLLAVLQLPALPVAMRSSVLEVVPSVALSICSPVPALPAAVALFTSMAEALQLRTPAVAR